MRVTPTRLPFRSDGVLIFGVDDETVERFVEDRAQEQRVGAAQVGTDAGIGDRLGDGDFAGEERLQRQNAAGVNQLDVQAVLLEVAGVVGNPGDRLVDRDGAVGQAQVCRFAGFSGARRRGDESKRRQVRQMIQTAHSHEKQRQF